MVAVWTMILLFWTAQNGATSQTLHYKTEAGCRREAARIVNLVKDHPSQLGAAEVFCVREGV